MDENVDWQGVLKKPVDNHKKPVDDVIHELEEIAEDNDLDEKEWDSVDDASDYLFENKVKKSFSHEQGMGDRVNFTPDLRFGVDVENLPEEWSRKYRKTQGTDEDGDYEDLSESLEIENLVIGAGLGYMNRGSYIDSLASYVDEVSFELVLDFEHDSQEEWARKYRKDEEDPEDYKQGGSKSWRMKDRDYSPISERIEVKQTYPEVKSYNEVNYEINIKEVSELVINMNDSTDPKKWEISLELEWY